MQRMQRIGAHAAHRPGVPGACSVWRFGAHLRQAVTGLLLASALAQAAAQCPPDSTQWQQVLPGIAVWHGLWPAQRAEGRPHWASSVLLWQGRRAMLLDSGATLCSGLRQRDQVQTWAGQGPRVVLLMHSHAHAEQVLASSAWQAPAAALPGTRAAMQQRCGACLAALGQDLGESAMAGTRIVMPERLLHPGQILRAGGRRWQVLEMPRAHTESDLVLWSAADGVLLAGGLIDGKGLVLAQGSVSGWLRALERIEALRPRWLIGQHLVAGPAQVASAIARQRQALCALVRRAWQGLERWQTEAEVLAQEAPEGDGAEQDRQRLNLGRAWRDMETLWLGREPMPLACRD